MHICLVEPKSLVGFGCIIIHGNLAWNLGRLLNVGDIGIQCFGEDASRAEICAAVHVRGRRGRCRCQMANDEGCRNDDALNQSTASGREHVDPLRL